MKRDAHTRKRRPSTANKRSVRRSLQRRTQNDLDVELAKNDFYTFVNQSWIQHKTSHKRENKYLNKIDDFRLVQYRVFDDLYDIIRRYSTDRSTRVSRELRHFFESSAAFNSIPNSKAYLETTVQQLDDLRRDPANLWKALAWINQNDLTNAYGPLVWRKAPDFQKPLGPYVDYLLPHQFAIFDLTSYSEKSREREKDLQKEYATLFKDYVRSLFHTTLPKDFSLNANQVFEVGKLFYSLVSKSEREKESNGSSTYGYSKVTRKEALSKYGFDWDQYCLALGYPPNRIPSFFYVHNIDYFQQCIEVLTREWNSDHWRSYWVWLVARYVARLTDQWERIFYSFYGKQAQGLETSIRSVKTHAIVNSCIYAFGPLLHNLYLDFAYDAERVAWTRNLAAGLRKTLISQLERNTWLHAKTRQLAIEKIGDIDIHIGSKQIAFIDSFLPLLGFDSRDYLGNFLKVAEWRHQLMLKGDANVLKALTMMDFTRYPAQIQNMPSFSVNALYSAQTNSIQVTTAYLQKPFLDMQKGLEYNVAYMGWTLAHEMTHALDNIGSLYDRRGALQDWWLPADRKFYHELQQDLVRQYEIFAKDDQYFKDKDFAFTMDEDLADIGGLQVCEEYLVKKEKDLDKGSDDKSLRQFYIYFAQFMRQRIERKSTQYQLIVNPHPIDKFRTNVPLSRSSLFRRLFDVQKGDGMYWHNDHGLWV